MIILIILYVISLLPVLLLTGFLSMAVPFDEGILIYLSIMLYVFSLLVSVPKAIRLRKKQQYKASNKAILTPLIFAAFIVMSFCIIQQNI